MEPVPEFRRYFYTHRSGCDLFLLAMLVLLDKRGKPYQFLSGYRFDKDRRGFDILPDGTHGTSGFMARREMGQVLEYGKIGQLSSTILGKSEDRYGDTEYISPKKDNGLNEHIMVFGASGADRKSVV